MFQALKKLICTPKNKGIASMLYTKAAAQSRDTFFWDELALEQTAPLRFEVIAFHVSLLLIALKEDKNLSQAVFDYMFDDFDACFREMGVSDLRVGKHVKLYAKHFYARLAIYGALGDKESRKHVAAFFEMDEKSENFEKLWAYMGAKSEKSKSWNQIDLRSGKCAF